MIQINKNYASCLGTIFHVSKAQSLIFRHLLMSRSHEFSKTWANQRRVYLGDACFDSFLPCFYPLSVVLQQYFHNFFLAICNRYLRRASCLCADTVLGTLYLCLKKLCFFTNISSTGVCGGNAYPVLCIQTHI